jgi:hypothetical protein
VRCSPVAAVPLAVPRVLTALLVPTPVPDKYNVRDVALTEHGVRRWC